MQWLDSYQAQIALLSAQISWSESVEDALESAADGKTKGTDALNRVYFIYFFNLYKILVIIYHSVS